MFPLIRILKFALLAVTLLVAGFTLYLDYRVRDEFEGRRFAAPARVYARPLELHAGLRLSQAAIEQELRQLGYRETAGESESGWFARSSDGIEIALRPFVFWDGPQPAQRLRLAFDRVGVATLRNAENRDISLARLDP